MRKVLAGITIIMTITAWLLSAIIDPYPALPERPLHGAENQRHLARLIQRLLHWTDSPSRSLVISKDEINAVLLISRSYYTGWRAALILDQETPNQQDYKLQLSLKLDERHWINLTSPAFLQDNPFWASVTYGLPLLVQAMGHHASADVITNARNFLSAARIDITQQSESVNTANLAVQLAPYTEQLRRLDRQEWTDFEAYITQYISAVASHPQAENHRISSALLAITLHCTDSSFFALARAALPTLYDDAKPLPTCQQLTVSGQLDTRKHFLLSALITSIAGPELALQIGTAKEEFDDLPLKGNSGFCPKDMAANKAGIKFAQTWLQPSGSRKLTVTTEHVHRFPRRHSRQSLSGR